MTSVLSTISKAGLFAQESFGRLLWTRVSSRQRGLWGSSQFPWEIDRFTLKTPKESSIRSQAVSASHDQRCPSLLLLMQLSGPREESPSANSHSHMVRSIERNKITYSDLKAGNKTMNTLASKWGISSRVYCIWTWLGLWGVLEMGAEGTPKSTNLFCKCPTKIKPAPWSGSWSWQPWRV